MNLSDYLFEPSWINALAEEFKKDYFLNLQKKLDQEYAQKKNYPNPTHIFSAFNLTPLDKIKVVIIGQDPYHRPNQAHGLCFSVSKNVKIPPSLVNIYKELENDLGIKRPTHGFLQSWAEEGVLLLNSILTVEDGKPMSHKDFGWEIFTDLVIEIINQKRENIVFMLWGAPAQKKLMNSDLSKHYILKSVHPSPLSAYRGFFGCQHFSLCNQFLMSKGMAPIDWRV